MPTLTQRGTATYGGGSSSTSSGSFTPSANSLMVVARTVEGASTGYISGITGHAGGGSWVQIHSIAHGANDVTTEVWAALVGASPSAGTITVTPAGYVGRSVIEFLEISGVNTSGTVANVFGQEGSVAGYDLRDETLTLGSFASATNMTLAVAAFQFNTDTSVNWTDGIFTEGGDLRYPSGPLHQECAWLEAADPTIAVTFQNWTWDALIGLEVKEASVSGAAKSLGLLLRGCG